MQIMTRFEFPLFNLQRTWSGIIRCHAMWPQYILIIHKGENLTARDYFWFCLFILLNTDRQGQPATITYKRKQIGHLCESLQCHQASGNSHNTALAELLCWDYNWYMNSQTGSRGKNRVKVGWLGGWGAG